MVRDLIAAARELAETAGAMKFGGKIVCTYNPLEYAWEPHEKYITAFGGGRKKILFLGMNPGPWGMAQTGIPFGEVEAARDWLGIKAPVGRPDPEHPKRPVRGFSCPRSEVSGRRLWGLMAHRYGSPEEFFREHYVLNYCPLVFMEASGKNLTPDKLSKSESQALYEACDLHLSRVIEILRPHWLLGVGRFALRRLSAAAPEKNLDWILHPSPANPAANKGWAQAVTDKMAALGIWD